MKKIFVCMGLATAGAAACQLSSMGQSSFLGDPKVWNVSAELDGFYDNNYVTAANKKGGFGAEVSPTFSADIPLTQTEIGVLYTYGLQWYNDREPNDVWSDFDQSHSLSLWLDHAFNERWDVKLKDSFADGQDPGLLNANGTGGSPLRLNGNNWNNTATADLHTDWTRLLSSDLTYVSGLYEYSEQGAYTSPTTPGYLGDFYTIYSGGLPSSGKALAVPSYAGSLNRMQNSVNLDLQWHFSPETTFSAGYQFLIVNYIGDEIIGYYNAPYLKGGSVYYNKNGLPAITYSSDNRDNYSHIAYVGVQENLLASLVVAGRIGVQYNDQYNEAAGDPQDPYSTTPYANISLIYTYLPDCTVQLGFSQNRTATDIVSVNQGYGLDAFSGGRGSLTADEDTSALYASINHHFTPKLLASLIGSWNYSTFSGGQYAEESETLYGIGATLNYAITRHVSANANYMFDYLSSPIFGRGYDRQRVSMGLSLSY